MDRFGTVELVVIIITILFSIRGFSNTSFFQRYLFTPREVLINWQYYRLLSAGFLHVGSMHLIFNMVTLYFFGGSIEMHWGSAAFAFLYFTGMISGNLLSLYIHRHNLSYRAVGASGAVSAVIFAAISLNPSMSLYLFFIPIPIPAWIVGLGFVIYSIYGIYSQKDNIGHEAHLGGAVVGILLAIFYFPEILSINLITISLMLIPIMLFILVLMIRPQLMQGILSSGKPEYSNLEDQYHNRRKDDQQELDRLLDKIRRKGMESLSPEEEERLKELSN